MALGLHNLELILQFLLLIAVAAALWVAAEDVGRRLVGEGEPRGGQAGPASARDLQAVAFTTVGLFLAAFAIPTLLQVLALRGPQPGGVVAQTVEYGVQLIIGLLLLFGGRGLSRFVASIRTAGLPARDHDRPD